MAEAIVVSMVRQAHGPWQWQVSRDGERVAEGEHFDRTAAINAASAELASAVLASTPTRGPGSERADDGA